MNVIAKPDKDDWYSLPYDKEIYNEFDLNEVKNLKIGVFKYWGMNNFFNQISLENSVEVVYENILKKLKQEGLQLTFDSKVNWPNNPTDIFKTSILN